MILVNVHGPNKKAHNFFSNLSTKIDKDHIKSKLILLGDWNAQIGKEALEVGDEKYVGKKLGFEECNENGEDFKIFLQIHQLQNLSSKIGVNTEVTWKSGNRKSQIDHVVKAVSSSIRIRFIKGFWTTVNTDHKLILMDVVLKEARLAKSKHKAFKYFNPQALMMW